jgi:hypothetical protein
MPSGSPSGRINAHTAAVGSTATSMGHNSTRPVTVLPRAPSAVNPRVSAPPAAATHGVPVGTIRIPVHPTPVQSLSSSAPLGSTATPSAIPSSSIPEATAAPADTRPHPPVTFNSTLPSRYPISIPVPTVPAGLSPPAPLPVSQPASQPLTDHTVAELVQSAQDQSADPLLTPQPAPFPCVSPTWLSNSQRGQHRSVPRDPAPKQELSAHALSAPAAPPPRRAASNQNFSSHPASSHVMQAHPAPNPPPQAPAPSTPYPQAPQGYYTYGPPMAQPSHSMPSTQAPLVASTSSLPQSYNPSTQAPPADAPAPAPQAQAPRTQYPQPPQGYYTYGPPTAQPAQPMAYTQAYHVPSTSSLPQSYYPPTQVPYAAAPAPPPQAQIPRTQYMAVPQGYYTYGPPTTQSPQSMSPTYPVVSTSSYPQSYYAPQPMPPPTPAYQIPQATTNNEGFNAAAWGAHGAASPPPTLMYTQSYNGYPVGGSAHYPHMGVAGPSRMSTAPIVPSNLSYGYTAPPGSSGQKRSANEVEDDDEIQIIPNPHKRSKGM